MIKKIKSYSLSIVALLTLLAPTMVPVMASAACSTTASNVSNGVNIAVGGSSDNCSSTNVNNNDVGKAAREIVTLFSIIVGVVSIIMIIYGGFRYITSGGRFSSCCFSAIDRTLCTQSSEQRRRLFVETVKV